MKSSFEKCGIYAIKLADGRCYVGSSVRVYRRWGEHRALLRTGKHHSPHMQNAWSKYGEDAFEFTLVEECSSLQLIAREQYWIDQLKPAFNYAKVAGSRAGIPQSPEAIEKVRKVHLGRKNSPETIAKMSLAAQGNQRAKGRVLSEEQCKAISERMKGNKSLVGRVMPVEHREKIAAAQRGKPHARGKGWKHSPETIEKMRAAALKRKLP